MSFRDKFKTPAIILDRPEFLFDQLPVNELSTTTTEAGRFYDAPSGIKLPSVTTVLGKSFDDSWLHEWRAKVGEEEATLVSNRAKERGTKIHALIENYLLDKPDVLAGIDSINPNYQSFLKMKRVIDAHLGKIRGVELPLWSERLKTAGRTDLCGEWNGVLSIIDWKTSNALKHQCDIMTYFLQSTCYGLMVEERYPGLRIPQIVIGIAVDHDEPQFFVSKKNDFLEETLRVFITDRYRNGI